MSKPWSKLQRDLYKIIDPSLDFQIQCRAYRMKNSASSLPQIPRYWITIGKEIVFDVPKNANLQQKHQMYDHIRDISDILREYINTPILNLLEASFANDTFGVANFLKAADRRLGKEKLIEWGANQDINVQLILKKRYS